MHTPERECRIETLHLAFCLAQSRHVGTVERIDHVLGHGIASQLVGATSKSSVLVVVVKDNGQAVDSGRARRTAEAITAHIPRGNPCAAMLHYPYARVRLRPRIHAGLAGVYARGGPV